MHEKSIEFPKCTKIKKNLQWEPPLNFIPVMTSPCKIAFPLHTKRKIDSLMQSKIVDLSRNQHQLTSITHRLNSMSTELCSIYNLPKLDFKNWFETMRNQRDVVQRRSLNISVVLKVKLCDSKKFVVVCPVVKMLTTKEPARRKRDLSQ